MSTGSAPWGATPSFGGPPTVFGSVGARFGAFVVDGLVTFAFLAPAWLLVMASGGESAVVLFAIFLYFAGTIANIVQYCRKMGRDGQSIGYKACGIRLVDARTGQPVGAGRVFGRAIVRGLGAWVCLLGVLWILWEPRRRGWHDMATNTVVVPADGSSAPSPGGYGSYQSAPPPPPLLDAPGAPAPPPAGIGAVSYAAPAAPPAPPAAPPPPAPVAAHSMFEHAPPPAPPAAPSVVSPQIAAVPSLDDDRTIARAELRPPASVPAPPPAFAAPTFVLEFDQGRREVLDRTLLVGRDPAPSPTDPGAALIALADPTMSVSKTHMAVGLDGGAVWVEDRHSTNGVTVTTGGETLKIVAGKRVTVAVGTVVRFGDRSLTVVSG